MSSVLIQIHLVTLIARHSIKVKQHAPLTSRSPNHTHAHTAHGTVHIYTSRPDLRRSRPERRTSPSPSVAVTASVTDHNASSPPDPGGVIPAHYHSQKVRQTFAAVCRNNMFNSTVRTISGRSWRTLIGCQSYDVGRCTDFRERTYCARSTVCEVVLYQRFLYFISVLNLFVNCYRKHH